MLPSEELADLKAGQQEILNCLLEIKGKISPASYGNDWILAEDFMKQTKMKKTKFYDMVNNNKIRVLRKLRKTYVLASEVKRFFEEPSMS